MHLHVCTCTCTSYSCTLYLHAPTCMYMYMYFLHMYIVPSCIYMYVHVQYMYSTCTSYSCTLYLHAPTCMYMYMYIAHTNLTTYPPINDPQNLPTLSLQLFPLTSCTQSISLVCSNILKYHGTMSKNTTLSELTGSRLLISVTIPPLSRPDPDNVRITYNNFILLCN